MRSEAAAALHSLGLDDVDLDAEVGSLGVGSQQLVEIARAVRTDAKLIIMDEPTAALSEKEANELLRIVKDLKAQGHAIIYVSHRLTEVKEICDTITVLRDGKTVETRPLTKTSIDDMVRLMVGREITNKYPKITVPIGKEMLRVEGLTRKGVIDHVSFTLHSGEILGFAGLVGAGRTETMRALTGADPLDSGKIFVDGKQVRIKNPRDSINAGIAFLTEDRKGQGLILIQSIEFNSTLVNLKSFRLHPKLPFLNLKKAKQAALKMVRDLRTRTPSVEQNAGNLSGGNQQKVVIAKWLLTKCKIFIVDEPTRGIDVGAKVEVYNLINELISGGAAVIMVSSEMDECIGMADRVVVMYEGKISAELSGADLVQEKIMYAASGLNQQEHAVSLKKKGESK
jgi:ribose transport system ATP-binding protein